MCARRRCLGIAEGRVNGRDDLLRAHVFRAFAAKGTDRFAACCRDVVDGYMLWPAVEAELAMQRVRRQRDQEEAELLAWYYTIPTLSAPVRACDTAVGYTDQRRVA